MSEVSRQVSKILHTKRRSVGIQLPDHPITLGLVGLLGPHIITTVAALPDGPVERTPYEIAYKFRAHLGLVIDGGIIPPAPANIIARIDVPDINRESKKTVALFT